MSLPAIQPKPPAAAKQARRAPKEEAAKPSLHNGSAALAAEVTRERRVSIRLPAAASQDEVIASTPTSEPARGIGGASLPALAALRVDSLVPDTEETTPRSSDPNDDGFPVVPHPPEQPKEGGGFFGRLKSLAMDSQVAVQQALLQKKVKRPKNIHAPQFVQFKRTAPPRSVQAGGAIQLCLGWADQGDTVILQAGTYQQTITIQKEVVIKAAPGANVVLEADGTVITIDTYYCRLENITVISHNKKKPAIVIEKGSPELVNCDISGAGGGVVVNKGADAHLQNCALHDSKRAFGIQFINATGTMENCRVFGNRDAGIIIDEPLSNPWIYQCAIQNGKGCGVLVDKNGQGVMIDCEVTGNACPGVLVQGGGNPVVHRCTFCKGQASGIVITDSGKGIVDGNRFIDQGDHDIEVTRQGNPMIRNNVLSGNSGSSISVYGNGLGVIEANEIQDCQTAGILIRDGGAAAVVRNTIKKADGAVEAAAIIVCNDAKPEVRDNTLRGWRKNQAPIQCKGGAAPKLKNNTVD